jgi:MFS family permease
VTDPKVRWKIAVLISAAIAISYFDRQTLSVAIKAIQLDIPISNTQFSQLQASFLTAYALMYAGGGKLVDVLGTRSGFLVIMVWWSLACASHGLATGFGLLLVSRFMLGMGEGGGFSGSHKSRVGVVPHTRTRHSNGDDQCRHRDRCGMRTAFDCLVPRRAQLALGLFSFGRGPA